MYPLRLRLKLRQLQMFLPRPPLKFQLYQQLILQQQHLLVQSSHLSQLLHPLLLLRRQWWPQRLTQVSLPLSTMLLLHSR